MKFRFTLIPIFAFFSSFSQQLYFSSKNLRDSAALQSSLAQLATQVIKIYKEEDKDKYLNDLFLLEIAAEEYEKSLATLNALKDLYRITSPSTVAAKGFSYKAFAVAKLNQVEKSESFNESFINIFPNLYNSLTESQAIVVDRAFDIEVLPLRESFENLLKKQKNKDSIYFEDAKQICLAYVRFNVNKHIVPLAKPFLKEAENKLYLIEDSVKIKMRDGAIVQAIVVRKKSILAAQPAIFNFNIYIGATDKFRAKNAAVHGYVGVIANTRGKGLSPQKIEPFEQDARDAYDIIDWISKQPWCNGKVGMYGGSYLGFSQWAATKNVHPALKTIIPQVAVGIGIDYPLQNNIFMSYMLRWIHFVSNNKGIDVADFQNEDHWNSTFTKWYVQGSSFRNLDSIEGRKSEIFQRWLQHPSHDSYWQNMVPYKTDFSNINIPVLTITGYYDDDQLGAMYYFKEHLKFNKNANHILFIGPYDHFGAQGSPSSKLQGYTIDSVANVNITELLFKWFDYTLKDSVRPEILKDKVNYEVMGANEWRHSSSIYKMNTDTLQFYFSNIHSGNYFKLLTKKPSQKEFIRQEMDYISRADTSDTGDEKVISKTTEPGEYLSFISEPFGNSTIINGSFLGEIKNSINKKDYDLNIRLYELLPDGTYFNLSYFLGRVSYIKDRSKRQLRIPGKEETIPYSNSSFTSKRISKGSRLVVLVGVNKNKYWQVNYGTGKDVSDETIQDGKIPLQIQWFNDSYIKIPIWRDSK